MKRKNLDTSKLKTKKNKRRRRLSKSKVKEDSNSSAEETVRNDNDNHFHNILSFLIQRYSNGFAVIEGVLNRVELKKSLCLRYDYIRIHLNDATIELNGEKKVFESSNFCSSWARDMRGLDEFREISMMPTEEFLKKSIEILNEKFLNKKVAIQVNICVKDLNSKFYNLIHIKEA